MGRFIRRSRLALRDPSLRWDDAIMEYLLTTACRHCLPSLEGGIEGWVAVGRVFCSVAAPPLTPPFQEGG
jgi:hypothetical protein